MIEKIAARLWLVARLVCLVRGHREEMINFSDLHPTTLCTRCYGTWHD